MHNLSNKNHDSVATTLLPCEAVLFDSDGVLVDSESIILRSWRRWAHSIGVNPDAVLATIHGRRSQDTVAQFVEAPARKEALDLIDSMEIKDAASTRPIPGAAALLKSIPKDHWAVVTSASPELARARLAAARIPPPKVLVTGGDVTHGKPHPEGYLSAASGLGVDPKNCVVVEDAGPGIRAARAARVRAVLGVGNLAAGEDEPDFVAPDLRYVRWVGAGLEVTIASSVNH